MPLSLVLNGEETQVVVALIDGYVTLQFHDSEEAYSLTKAEAEMLSSLLRNIIFKE
jgi:hypothetical protein